MPDQLDRVWQRIVAHAGAEFRTKTGLAFTYEVHGNVLRSSATKYNLGRSQFERMFPQLPTDGPGPFQQAVRGPSYVWAILMDPRIRAGEW